MLEATEISYFCIPLKEAHNIMSDKKIQSILISLYNKDGLEELLPLLKANQVKIYSTGGTYSYIIEKGYSAIEVENITGYPSILGGRVKTLHPSVFGGILARRSNEQDGRDLEIYGIPEIDAVYVDLYPFEETIAQTTDEATIIEKIDIGGVSLIRAGAKNFQDVLILPSKNELSFLKAILENKKGFTQLNERKAMAIRAFQVTAHYDSIIHQWFNPSDSLRYGENPHQIGSFKGNLNQLFDQLNGKEISYNNLLDLDAAMQLIVEFDEPTVAILKHNNACGVASNSNLLSAWQQALAGDPVAAFGGVVVSNQAINLATAEAIHAIFIEVIIAPGYEPEALKLLQEKKNRIILLQKQLYTPAAKQHRTVLNGILEQDHNAHMSAASDLKQATNLGATEAEMEDLLFANKLVKHLKSNAIAIVKNKQLIGSGCGQTSRIDALKQAIEKAKTFNFDLNGAAMASDAFFPFPDCVEVAHLAGINLVIQPGGSIKDQASIDYCNANNMSMYISGIRHFKH